MEEEKKESTLKELIEKVKTYEFDPKLLNAIPIKGILRKSKDPSKCILVTYQGIEGDNTIEIELNDIVKHEVEKQSENNKDDIVKLYVKQDTTITSSYRGKITHMGFDIPRILSEIGRKPGSTSTAEEQLEEIEWLTCRTRIGRQCYTAYHILRDRYNNLRMAGLITRERHQELLRQAREYLRNCLLENPDVKCGPPPLPKEPDPGDVPIIDPNNPFPPPI